ncbi:MAG: transporter [Microbacteriaceae bacterium]|jgi:MFS family permease|nr:transporter [Microbacteriaceae bacterium]
MSPSSFASADSAVTERRLLSPLYFWTTVGAFTLIFLGAFESLAVTTIMPTISRELRGDALYSLAFSGTLAASVIGMVVAGGWADRRGPAGPLVAAIVVFVLGLVLSGTATDMVTFIVGRVLQGLGSGAVNVALYVVVARIYPPALHPRVFGLFAAAWVLPSLIGPPVAGVIADTISWHWVFLGVGVLALIAAAAIVPALRQLGSTVAAEAPRAGWGVVWAVVVAVGVIAISVGGERGGDWSWAIAAVAFAIVIVALRPLVPRGTLLVWRGLPATVLFRGAVAAAFFATEVYLPYLLHDGYGLPSWLSGLILTVGAVSWALGSEIQGRLGERLSHDTAVRFGAVLLFVGIAVQFLTALLLLSPYVAAAGWLFAGGGMGLVFPRVSTLVLFHSTDKNQGFNSAAISIADAAGGASAIAFAGLLFVAYGAVDGGGFVAALGLTTVIALAAVPVAFRVRRVRV